MQMYQKNEWRLYRTNITVFYYMLAAYYTVMILINDHNRVMGFRGFH